MLLLVTRAAKTLQRYAHDNLGRLIQPRHFGGRWTGPWAADNDCFQGFDQERYERMLRFIASEPTTGLLFVTAPDVVGQAQPTLDFFRQWEPRLHRAELPVALVAQDGLQERDVPWDHIEALFLGGTTEFKMSIEASRLLARAKERGKHVHIGRVNSMRRIRYAQSVGADSIDGTAFSRYADIFIPRALRILEAGDQQGLAL